jgi:hypothetical protein
LLCIG